MPAKTPASKAKAGKPSTAKQTPKSPSLGLSEDPGNIASSKKQLVRARRCVERARKSRVPARARAPRAAAACRWPAAGSVSESRAIPLAALQDAGGKGRGRSRVDSFQEAPAADPGGG